MKIAADPNDQQAQRAQLEEKAIDVLVRMWFLECRGHSQDPSHAGNQPDEENGSAAIWW
jgi:hypothetical protein